MDDITLKSIIDAEIADCTGELSSELDKQRAENLDYYLSEPFGNEVDGRSKVVTSDVADTIEWMLPTLLENLHVPGGAVSFRPSGAGDEDAAEIETAAVNEVIYSQNPGFINDYSFVKDALLLKAGVEKIYFEEEEEVTREEFEGLTDDELLLISQDEELEIAEHSTTKEVIHTELGLVEHELHDVVFKRTKIKKKVVIEPVPPEELRVSRKARSPYIQQAPFVVHQTKKTVSDLVEMGLDEDKLKDIGSGGTDGDQLDLARDQYGTGEGDGDSIDESMRELKVYDCYGLIDYDGDGIAELRRILKVEDKIFINEEADFILFNTVTPIIMTHKFDGMAVADLVKDIQQVRSFLLRGVLNNIDNANNGGHVVNENVNLDDMLTSRPNRIVRTEGDPHADVAAMPFYPIADQAMGVMGFMDQLLQKRTGVGEMTQGLSQDVISDTAFGVDRMMSAAEKRIALIARVFAETGIKQRFMMVHRLLRDHGEPFMMQHDGKWIEVDPREWQSRNTLSVHIGLGTGERDKMVMMLNQIIQKQSEAIAGGGLGVLVQPKHVYNALTDMGKYAGISTMKQYFLDPDTPEAQQALQAQSQQQPDPTIEMLRAQMQLQQEQNQIQREKETLKHQKEMEEMRLKWAQLEQKRESDDDKIMTKLTELEAKFAVDVPGAAI